MYSLKVAAEAIQFSSMLGGAFGEPLARKKRSGKAQQRARGGGGGGGLGTDVLFPKRRSLELDMRVSLGGRPEGREKVQKGESGLRWGFRTRHDGTSIARAMHQLTLPEGETRTTVLSMKEDGK